MIWNYWYNFKSTSTRNGRFQLLGMIVMKKNYKFKVDRSTNDRLEIRCVNDNCKWRLHINFRFIHFELWWYINIFFINFFTMFKFWLYFQFIKTSLLYLFVFWSNNISFLTKNYSIVTCLLKSVLYKSFCL